MPRADDRPLPEGHRSGLTILETLSYWELRYDDWVRKTPSLASSGRPFHARLKEEFARHGQLEPHHPEEECHDRHVGACVEMIYGGQPEKGLAFACEIDESLAGLEGKP